MTNETIIKKVKSVCEQYDVAFLGLFGSQARGEQKDDSDIDLLIKFKQPVGYFTLVEVQQTFEKMFDRKVDLVTEKALSKYILPGVLKDIQTLYGSR